MQKVFYGAFAAALVTIAAVGAYADTVNQAGDVRQGRKLAIGTCAECHRVTTYRLMPRHSHAPDFVDIANSASITPTSLYVFLHTPHPTMPDLILSNQESTDVIAYILSLRKPNSN
jgi:mono/diheme cytochrome c family protein